MATESNYQATWERMEASLRGWYRDWATNRLRLAQSFPKENATVVEAWNARVQKILGSCLTANEFSSSWAAAQTASDSEARARQFADLLRSGFTIETLVHKVIQCIEIELENTEEIENLAREAVRRRRTIALGPPRAAFTEVDGTRYFDLFTEYEQQLEAFHVPIQLEPLIEASLYSIYIAASPRSRIVAPRNRLQLIRDLEIAEPLLYTISPREFEELLVHVYEALGLRVKLSKATRDWGADLLAWQPGPFGTESLIVIQAKLYRTSRKVSLAGVHGLHGAVAHYQADTGHLVATSDLTEPARTFLDELGYVWIDLKTLSSEVEGLLEPWTNS